MAEPTYPTTIDTLGKLIDHSMGALMLCRPCLNAGRPHVRDIDLNRLAGHLGRDWSFINRRTRTCDKPGHSWPERKKPLPIWQPGRGSCAVVGVGLAARETTQARPHHVV